MRQTIPDFTGFRSVPPARDYRLPFTSACAATAALTATAAAQPCIPAWSAYGPPGLGNSAYALANWDPDGGGPLPARLVAGGNFESAGGVPASRIASSDGVSWSPLGAGMLVGFPAAVNALVVASSGDLVAGGEFQLAGGVSAKYVASWNGAAWSPLGSGMDSIVRCVALYGNGGLIAGGDFSVAGGVPAGRVARWDGSAWLPMNTGGGGAGGVQGVRVNALLVVGDDVFVGGQFTAASGIPAHGIARWTPNSWSAVGSVSGVPIVYALARLPSGEIVAGGGFTGIGGTPASNIAMWNGFQWVPLGVGTGPSGNGAVTALKALASGELIAGGPFTTAGGLTANGIAAWSGGAWSALAGGVGAASGTGAVYSLAVLPDGDLLAGGFFNSAGGAPAAYVARWGCPECYPDCNPDGSLTVADFGCFQTKFVLGDPYADCDQSGTLTVADFGCFQTEFVAGCP